MPRGTYFYKVVAFDAAANLSAVSAASAEMVVPDYVAPTVPTGVSTTVSGGSVDVRWTASTDDVAVVDYRVYRGTSAGFTANAASKIADVTDTSYVDTPPANGTYYYRVVARDAAGNVSAASAAVAASVSVEAADVAAPSVPSGVAASVSGASVTVSWSASVDNVGVVGYRVYRGSSAGFTPGAGNRIAEQASRSYVDQGRPLGTWFYKVEAYDAAGNVSAASAAVSAEVVATTVVVTPSADARVHSVLVDSTFGGDVQLAATGEGAQKPLWSLLKFDLPAAPPGTSLVGVSVGLRTSGDPTAGSVDDFDVFVTGGGWNESGVTWSNRPTGAGAKVGVLSGATEVEHGVLVHR